MSHNLPEKIPFENDSIAAHADLRLIAEQINSSHQACELAARKTVEHAMEVGGALLRAKQLVGHGGFGSWLSENTKVSDRQARRYMALARDLPDRLTDEANRTRMTELTVAGALRLIDECDVPPDSILRQPLNGRNELVTEWPDIRWSRFTAFEAAGYTPVEIASIFDWKEGEVAAELDRLRSPEPPNRSDWLVANLGDAADYQAMVERGLMAQRSLIMGDAACSAESDLGKPDLANRLRDRAKAFSESLPDAGRGDFNREACARLCDRFGLERDDGGVCCVARALDVCGMSDIRAALGLEASRPMAELFHESLALQVEIAAMSRESAETGITISEHDQRARFDKIAKRLNLERSASPVADSSLHFAN